MTALALAFLATASTGAAQPLRTGILDWDFGVPADRTSLRTRTTGASLARVVLYWSSVAPSQPGDPEDPEDPVYQWQGVDRQVASVTRAGLDPVLSVSGSPRWARGATVGLPGTWPSPARFAEFARAAARRYNGSFVPSGESKPLPRVQYWQAWNEPNAGRELTPQRVGRRAVSPPHYRRMLNSFSDAVHAARKDNLVIAGTLAPFGHDSKDIQVLAPMTFMTELLCVSARPPHQKTCSQRSRFDIWAHNPYTNGGPTTRAHSPSDASIGDLPEMRAVLLAARKRGSIVSVRQPAFWVTEFSWDTNPPDPKGVPSDLHARWVAEALYRMWESGVSAVIWFRLRDDPLSRSPYQSGFFRRNWQPKSSLRAFRFPFVAFRTDRGVSVWGRTPFGKPGEVVVEARARSGWSSVARIRSDRNGIFSRLLQVPASTALLKARLVSPGEFSMPFALAVPPNRPATPFGCGGSIHC